MKKQKSLTEIADLQNVKDFTSPTKILADHIARIAIVNQRMNYARTGVSLLRHPLQPESLYQRVSKLKKELTNYRNTRNKLSRENYALDYSGFDNAVRSLVYREYWKLIK